MHAAIHSTAWGGVSAALVAFCIHAQPVFEVAACLVSVAAGLTSIALMIKRRH